MILGRVVGLEGEPVASATVRGDAGVAHSDSDGWFGIVAELRPQWLTVEHPDYSSRTRAARPGNPVLFRLTPDDGETLSIHFGGDTMFGRRFYDPNADGDVSDVHFPQRRRGCPLRGVERHPAAAG